MNTAVVQIGKCYSGVLCPPTNPLLRRMAIASRECYGRLTTDLRLRDLLKNDIQQLGHVNPENLKNAGFTASTFMGRADWQTFGVHYDRAEEKADFRQADAMLRSLAPGSHRYLLFGIWGINVPAEIASLPTNTYASLLAAIRMTCGDPRLENVSAIRLAKKGHLSLDSGPAGERILVLSVKQLEGSRFISYVEGLDLHKG